MLFSYSINLVDDSGKTKKGDIVPPFFLLYNLIIFLLLEYVLLVLLLALQELQVLF
jgi:hypothetical protein